MDHAVVVEVGSTMPAVLETVTTPASVTANRTLGQLTILVTHRLQSGPSLWLQYPQLCQDLVSSFQVSDNRFLSLPIRVPPYHDLGTVSFIRSMWAALLSVLLLLEKY